MLIMAVGNCAVVVINILVFSLILNNLTASAQSKMGKNFVDVGNINVFLAPPHERILRTRQEAWEYCNKRRGELIKVDYIILQAILQSNILAVPIGTYWIDGMLSGFTGIKSFTLNKTCTATDWPTNNNLLPVNDDEFAVCLAVTKGYWAKEFGIKVKNCEEKYHTICGIPNSGCSANQG